MNPGSENRCDCARQVVRGAEDVWAPPGGASISTAAVAEGVVVASCTHFKVQLPHILPFFQFTSVLHSLVPHTRYTEVCALPAVLCLMCCACCAVPAAVPAVSAADFAYCCQLDTWLSCSSMTWVCGKSLMGLSGV